MQERRELLSNSKTENRAKKEKERKRSTSRGLARGFMSTAKIIVLRNDGSDGVHFPLPEQRNSLVFGRSVTCDVRIDRNTVSAEHAKMELSPSGQWLLKHLSSSNPTYLNGTSASLVVALDRS